MFTLYDELHDISPMALELVVLPMWIMIENDFPYTHTALYGVHQDILDIVIPGGKEAGILIAEIAEKSGVTAACRSTSKVLNRVHGWIGGGDIPGVVFGD